ncbi:MAG: hypothetical protein JXP37_08000 [Coriobacteriia bacterium]|jgi:hypothetical protein|nr:hypothetical protein [Coriobacteriia bacterium]
MTAAAPSKAAEKRTIYFAPNDVYEAGIAKVWAEKQGRKIATGLPLTRLTADMVIVPIVRDPSRTPLRYEEFDRELGRPKQRQRKPEELIGEIHECTPIPVSKFWSTDGETVSVDDFAETVGGMLDTTAFIDAVNKSTGKYEVYARTHHGDQDSILRLSWGS